MAAASKRVTGSQQGDAIAGGIPFRLLGVQIEQLRAPASPKPGPALQPAARRPALREACSGLPAPHPCAKFRAIVGSIEKHQ
jgi:hypothetical protein